MIWTSYFRCPLLKKFPKEKIVAISIGIPKGWSGRRELRLAPTYKMLKMSHEEYYFYYDAILAKLDPHKVIEELDGCVLLCWESDRNHCHRAYVGAWLEKAGATVAELTGGSLVVGQQPLKL